MVAHLAGVICEPRRARRVVGRLQRVEVRLDRHLRVDDDLAAAGEAHDHVGAEPLPLVARRRLLLVEVAVRDHPCDLDDAAELDLAPAPANLRRAERGHELAGLEAELLLALTELLHLLGQRRRTRAARLASSWRSSTSTLAS